MKTDWVHHSISAVHPQNCAGSFIINIIKFLLTTALKPHNNNNNNNNNRKKTKKKKKKKKKKKIVFTESQAVTAQSDTERHRRNKFPQSIAKTQ